MNIEALDEHNVESASRLANTCFSYDPAPSRPSDWFHASLSPKKKEELMEITGYPVGQFLQYWIAKINGQCIGTTGLYGHPPDEHEALWVGWFCIAQLIEERGSAVGY